VGGALVIKVLICITILKMNYNLLMPKIITMRRFNTCGLARWCALGFMLAFHLAGCEQGDDDVDTEQEDGGLAPGEAVIHLVRTRTMPDGEVEVTEHEFYSSGAAIWKLSQYTPDYEDAWALEIPLVGAPDYYVFVHFKSPGPNPSQLAEGDGPGYAVYVDVPEKELGGDSPFDGVVHITELSGARASGDVTVGVDVEIWNHVQEEPAGETIRVESAAFNGIPVQGG
jgi:hypothetical protein